jgi:N4-gp56 family major capsid protein|tara:strand:+ start:10633 stop:11481 length:849 start_codon:yes stop_codon:yes gene_type:complete
MAVTTTTTLNDLYANIVQSALFTLSEKTVIRPLVRNYNMVGTPGLVAQIPKYGTIAAAAVGEGTDLTHQAFTSDVTTVTASEIGVNVTLTDIAREGAAEDVASAIGRQIGEGMALKVDQDLATLFTGFSQTVGTGDEEITIEMIFKAAAMLRNANAPGNFVGVLHPYQAFQIKKQLTNAGATMSHSLSDVGNMALKDGFIGRIAGVDLFESTVVGVGADSAGSFAGAVMSSDALAYMVKRDMRIEEERDASLRATEFIGSMAFGVSELFDLYGVGLIGDAQL